MEEGELDDYDSNFEFEQKELQKNSGIAALDNVEIFNDLFDGLSEEGEIESDENDDSVKINTDAIQPTSANNVCHVCNTEKPKYRCPACESKTCSLKCCQRHKILSDCDGSAPRSRMVSLNKYDSFTMLNDYRFLEEAVRLREKCRKVNESTRKFNFRFQAWNQLVRECRRRHTRLYKMPLGLEKHQKNQSFFEKLAETIFWNIEWIFVDANNTHVRMQRIPETVSLATLLKQILQPRTSSDYFEVSKQLTNYGSIDLSEIKCVMKVERNCWTKDQRYYELNVGHSVKENLFNKTVVEHPTFYACLPDSFSSFHILTDEMKAASKIDSNTSENSSETFVKFSSNNRRRGRNRKFHRKNKRRVRQSTEAQISSNDAKESNNDNGNVVQDDNKNLPVENIAVNGEENSSVVKPLKRLLKVRKNPPPFSRNSSGSRNSTIAHFQNCRLEKKEAIYQLAQELKQKDQDRKHLVDDIREKCAEKKQISVTERDQNTTVVAPPSKKVNFVKTAFFGILGDDDDDVSMSDSE